MNSLAQSTITKQITIEAPQINFSALALVSTLPQRLAADDSLLQMAYRRNHVRTVTLLRTDKGSTHDTVDYTEVDRHGNLTLFRPYFGQRYRQVFNRRQQVIEKVTYPISDDRPTSRVIYDPATRVTTSFCGFNVAHLATYQTARVTQRHDTTETEAFLSDVPGVPVWPLHRVLMRSFRVGMDTLRFDVVGYDAGQRVRSFECYYNIGNRRQPSESGEVRFGMVEPLKASAREAQQLLATSRHTHGRYLPTSHFTYNTQGALVRTRFTPIQKVTPPVPQNLASADGSLIVNIEEVSDTTSVRYVRSPQGWLQREEMWIRGHVMPVTDAQFEAPQLSFTEYTYWPNGLRKTKSGSLSARYEYRYTYY
jgi:hypothetical protein